MIHQLNGKQLFFLLRYYSHTQNETAGHNGHGAFIFIFLCHAVHDFCLHISLVLVCNLLERLCWQTLYFSCCLFGFSCWNLAATDRLARRFCWWYSHSNSKCSCPDAHRHVNLNKQCVSNFIVAALIAADMINNGSFPGVLPNSKLIMDTRLHFFSPAVSSGKVSPERTENLFFQ